MATWGPGAWDNDEAADWLRETMDASRIPKKVRKALAGDIEEDHAVMWAAAWMVVQLGRIYVWPEDELEADLAAALQVLEDLLAHEQYQDTELQGAIRAEVTELRSRLQE